MRPSLVPWGLSNRWTGVNSGPGLKLISPGIHEAFIVPFVEELAQAAYLFLARARDQADDNAFDVAHVRVDPVLKFGVRSGNAVGGRHRIRHPALLFPDRKRHQLGHGV